MSYNERRGVENIECLPRSKSFTGPESRSMTFSTREDGTPSLRTLSRSSTLAFPSLAGFSWNNQPPKVPRPERVELILQTIIKNLGECIYSTQEDISKLTSGIDAISVGSSQSHGKFYDLEKQLKSAERYQKKLDFHLSKVEELKEQYEIQQKMREGVRSMVYAYVVSSGKERNNALHKVRTNFKACTARLCQMELELENLMGTLLLDVKGIQGFARVCSGDVFEVTVKHGRQKWKSRTKIHKDGHQVWDTSQVLFKALLGEALSIKAVEVRTLTKNVVLGKKSCETRDLFSAHPQVMTVDLNPSGSLKLTILVTWNPLHGCDTMPLSKTTSSLGTPLIHHRPLPRSDEREPKEQHRMSVSSCGQSPLQTALEQLTVILEDVQGHYPELHSLNLAVSSLNKLLCPSNSGSDVSLSVESALECFDFLDTALDDISEEDSSNGNIIKESTVPKVQGNTSDSGFSSVARQLSSSASSPFPVTTGCEELDMALTVHLRYCHQLVEKLGTYGPLMHQELSSLTKLRHQASILENLLELCQTNNSPFLSAEKFVRVDTIEWWHQLGSSSSALYLPIEEIRPPLEEVILSSSTFNTPSLVSQILLEQILDTDVLQSESLVTIFQLDKFLDDQGPLELVIASLISDLTCVESLKSEDLSQLQLGLASISSTCPSPLCLRALSRLLLDSSTKDVAAGYLHHLPTDILENVIANYQEQLEDKDGVCREGAVLALSVLEAKECMEQLAYLFHSDPEIAVREQARLALLGMGEEGRRLYEQSQLFNHGFQGLGLH